MAHVGTTVRFHSLFPCQLDQSSVDLKGVCGLAEFQQVKTTYSPP